ncbi:hypothetical protein [Synechococcus sp. M16CYN]
MPASALGTISPSVKFGVQAPNGAPQTAMGQAESRSLKRATAIAN